MSCLKINKKLTEIEQNTCRKLNEIKKKQYMNQKRLTKIKTIQKKQKF